MSAAAKLPTTLAVRRPTMLAATWEVLCKDLRIELRTREIVATAGVFAIVVGVLASLAFYVDDKTNPATAAGTIWITVFFASVLSFSRIWQRERDESALTGLLVSPIPRASIFLGKALSAFATILALAVPMVALCMFLFHIDFSTATPRDLSHADQLAREAEGPFVHALAFAGLLALGTLALSLLGTLFGAMTVRTRARDLVLAIVLFPLLSPVLVCGVVGTRRAFETQPVDAYSAFVVLMASSVFIALLLGMALFGALVDD